MGINKKLITLLLIACILGTPALPRVGGVHAENPLAEIRHCESEGDYEAISDNGMYFGAYQFSVVTWAFVGGHGLPHMATVEEQDYRAWLLFTKHGAHHWPVCGRNYY